MQVLVKKNVENIGIDLTSIRSRMNHHVQEFPIHYDEVASNTVKRADPFREIC
jgi:hypothetical protein